MKRVIIESPYRGTPDEVARNERYLDYCIQDCYRMGWSPFASHAIGPRVLNDCDGRERAVAMIAGFAWYRSADMCAIYTDLLEKDENGEWILTEGMAQGKAAAAANGVPVQYRRCEEWRG